MARADAALWSINERLGALLEWLGAPPAGAALPEPSIDWVADLFEAFKAEDEDEADAEADPLPNIPGTITE